MARDEFIINPYGGGAVESFERLPKQRKTRLAACLVLISCVFITLAYIAINLQLTSPTDDDAPRKIVASAKSSKPEKQHLLRGEGAKAAELWNDLHQDQTDTLGRETDKIKEQRVPRDAFHEQTLEQGPAEKANKKDPRHAQMLASLLEGNEERLEQGAADKENHKDKHHHAEHAEMMESLMARHEENLSPANIQDLEKNENSGKLSVPNTDPKIGKLIPSLDSLDAANPLMDDNGVAESSDQVDPLEELTDASDQVDALEGLSEVSENAGVNHDGSADQRLEQGPAEKANHKDMRHAEHAEMMESLMARHKEAGDLGGNLLNDASVHSKDQNEIPQHQENPLGQKDDGFGDDTYAEKEMQSKPVEQEPVAQVDMQSQGQPQMNTKIIGDKKEGDEDEQLDQLAKKANDFRLQNDNENASSKQGDPKEPLEDGLEDQLKNEGAAAELLNHGDKLKNHPTNEAEPLDMSKKENHEQSLGNEGVDQLDNHEDEAQNQPANEPAPVDLSEETRKEPENVLGNVKGSMEDQSKPNGPGINALVDEKLKGEIKREPPGVQLKEPNFPSGQQSLQEIEGDHPPKTGINDLVAGHLSLHAENAAQKAKEESVPGEGGISVGILRKLLCWLRPEQGLEFEGDLVSSWKDSSPTEPKFHFDSLKGSALRRAESDYKRRVKRAAEKAKNPRYKMDPPPDDLLTVKVGPSVNKVGDFTLVQFPCGMVAEGLAMRDQMTLFFVLAPGFIEHGHVSHSVGQRFFGHYPNGQLRFHEGHVSIKTVGGDLYHQANEKILDHHFVVAGYRFNQKVEISVNGEPFGLDDDSNRSDVKFSGGSSVTLGGTNHDCGFYGQIAEVMIFGSVLGDAEASLVVRYLGEKYGISVDVTSLENKEEGKAAGEEETLEGKQATVSKRENKVDENKPASSSVVAAVPESQKKVNEKKTPDSHPETVQKTQKGEEKQQPIILPAEKKIQNGEHLDPNHVVPGSELDHIMKHEDHIEQESKNKKISSKKDEGPKPPPKPKNSAAKARGQFVKGNERGTVEKHGSRCTYSAGVEKWLPPDDVDLEAEFKWKNAQEAMLKKVRGFQKGGEALKQLIRGEKQQLEILRHGLFCH